MPDYGPDEGEARIEARDGFPMPDTFDEVVAAIPIAISGLITVVEHNGKYAVDSVSVDLDYREGTVSYYVGTCECETEKIREPNANRPPPQPTRGGPAQA